MEFYKMSKIWNNSTASKIVTRKRIEVNYLSGGQCSVNKNIRFKTPMLRSDLCDYSDVYAVVKSLHLRIMLRLDHACQKSITHS